ncbi:hypothetical protein PFICI_10688 [Pestalotiopsis fici W106-1]|uniref:Uncharacterized protein n=1 Tax=Pestalotiopsis fici (strain W106-1 / CGMCC3.15140) TaxID=1229662 RepID=W3X0G0_PESFW|nr:uncharacterized protein PFICI_10688 [Pestalotiopsis fici W106-1]ETS78626.1 hypothetical protein PFICI_10688 [Pestalotiopsis fici W106-1]
MSNNLVRTVFGTSTAADTQHPKIFGAVEVGLRFENGKISDLQVLYRALDGAIFDITSSIELSFPPSGNPTAELTLKRKRPSETPAIGFTITVSRLTQKDEASFSGTLERDTGTLPWNGRFVAFRSSPLSVIQKGLKPIDSMVQSFLDMSPLLDLGGRKEAEDGVQTWAAVIFKEMLQNATPQRAKDLFNMDSGEIGSVFVEKYYSGDHLPQMLKKTTTYCRYLALQNIYDDNFAMFQMASWHHLVHWLKSVDWLEREFVNSIRDKISVYYDMLRCPDSELDKWKNEYGSGFPAAQNATNLRKQYTDAIQRCYFAAYYCFSEDNWDDFMEKPRVFYQQVREVLLSDSWLEHWLPRLINLKDNRGELPVHKRLGLLRDKLKLLGIVGQSLSPGEPAADVDAVIERLAKAAGETGIVSIATMITPDSKSIPLSANEIFSEEGKRDINREIAFPMEGGLSFTAEDVESRATHAFLRDDATPLGLYDWHFHFSLFG